MFTAHCKTVKLDAEIDLRCHDIGLDIASQNITYLNLFHRRIGLFCDVILYHSPIGIITFT